MDIKIIRAYGDIYSTVIFMPMKLVELFWLAKNFMMLIHIEEERKTHNKNKEKNIQQKSWMQPRNSSTETVLEFLKANTNMKRERERDLLPLIECSEGECQWHDLSSYWVPFISIYPAPPPHFNCIHKFIGTLLKKVWKPKWKSNYSNIFMTIHRLF